ncbi:DNA replication protein psf1 [Malassezia sp. CBS 17886]|nr:DNA replication protein psf1 [Malassezia sp. CBS 17886]
MASEQALYLVHEARLSIATGALRQYNAEQVRQVLAETRQIHNHLALLADRARAQQPADDMPLSGASAGDARGDPAVAAQLVSYHLQAYRNKRCLLAYHKQRLDWLKQRVWDKAGALALVLEDDTGGTAEPVSLRALLGPAELEWLRKYTALLAMYKDTFLDVLDVSLPLASGAHSAATDRAEHIVSTKRARDALQGEPASFGASAVTAYEAHVPPNSIRAPDDLMVTVLVLRDARDVELERGTMQLRAGERLHVRRDEVEGLLLRGWLRVLE